VKRLAIFAHFDAQDEVKPFVEFHLDRLRTACDAIHFVSTANLPARELDKVAPYCEFTTKIDNRGYDFLMWSEAIEKTDLSQWDELVLTNSSVFGPACSLTPIFQRMTRRGCDFWGMTESSELKWHLQSYFLVFKRPVLQSPAFSQFWRSVLPYDDKNQAIFSYEFGLTAFLHDSGFSGAAFVPESKVANAWWHPNRKEYKKKANPTIDYPRDLVVAGMPYVKAQVFRENPGEVHLPELRRAMKRRGYDLSLLEFDRPVIERAS